MKKIVNVVVLFLLMFSLSSCSNIKNYKNEVSAEEFNIYSNKLTSYNFDRDFELKQVIKLDSKQIIEGIDSVTGEITGKMNMKTHHKVDFDNKIIREEENNSSESTTKTANETTTNKEKINMNSFYQYDGNVYKQYVVETKSFNVTNSFENVVKKLTLFLDVDFEKKDEIKYFIDGDICTIEAIIDDVKAVVQTTIKDNSINLVAEISGTVSLDLITTEFNINAELNYDFKNINLDVEDVSEYE